MSRAIRPRAVRPRPLLVAALTAGLLLAACGDDEDEDASSATSEESATTVELPADEQAIEDEATEEEVTEDEATEDEATEAGSAAAGEVLEVEALDYAFAGLPETVTADTKLSFTNSSEVELHELVAMRLLDSEDRPVAEIVALPQEELMGLFPEPPATVLVAPPGGAEQITAVGDGTLEEPGRYALVCFIPTGADPAAYMEQSGPDGPPDVAGGPPHVAHGMFAELVVE